MCEVRRSVYDQIPISVNHGDIEDTRKKVGPREPERDKVVPPPVPEKTTKPLHHCTSAIRNRT